MRYGGEQFKVFIASLRYSSSRHWDRKLQLINYEGILELHSISLHATLAHKGGGIVYLDFFISFAPFVSELSLEI